MGLNLVEQTPFSALTVADMHDQINLYDDSQNYLVQAYIDSAVIYVERTLGLDLRSIQWALVLPSFACRIDLLRGPLVSIDSVDYYDTNNEAQTLDASLYAYALSTNLPSKLYPAFATPFPDTYCRPDAVTITFTTGFVTVPANILQALRLLVGHWWMVREDSQYEGSTAPVPNAVAALLKSHWTGAYH